MLSDYIHEALKRAQLHPSRARGQHFLIDDMVLAQVVQAAQLDGSEYVVEIGPGLGSLTLALAARCKRLYAFELDDTLVRYLKGWVLPETRNVLLEDVAFNKYVFEPVLAAAQAAGAPLKVVTNLPYQISSAFLHTVVDYRADIAATVVMLQREVAARVVARVGDSQYGSFSLYLQAHLRPHWVCDVPAACFYPRPKVESAVLAISERPAAARPAAQDFALYLKLIEGVFRHRRKQLQNALCLAYPHLGADGARALLEAAGISPQARPQEVDEAGYVRLADALATW